MGVCHNFRKGRNTIKVNENNSINDKNSAEKPKEKNENKNLVITHPNDIQYSDYPTQVTESNPYSKISHKAPSNSSSNSSHMLTTPNISLSSNFIIEATIGEIEIPIYVEKNEIIMINIKSMNDNNSQNMWSFFPNENPVDYLGYQNYQYNNYNIGALLLRISGSQNIYHLDKTINSLKVDSKGSLLISANLDPNNYLIYEPKGSLLINIKGNFSIENELSSQNNINSYISEKKDIKLNYNNNEIKILNYINKARNNLNKFINDYFLIDEINQELKEFMEKKIEIKELQICDKLNMASKEHCEDLCKNNISGETGTDGSNSSCRIKRYYKNSSFQGENIIYGINNPLLIVKRIILDKYSKNKKNRENLFSNNYNKIGICIGEHLAYKFCCVIDFSD